MQRRRRIERTIAVMRHRPVARRGLDLDLARRQGDRLVGDRAEAGDRSGGDVKDARRTVLEHKANDLSDVVDIDVVAALLALAEQYDGLAAIGLTAKSVRSVAIVRIAGAINERRPQDRERRRARSGEQHLFACQMHGAVQTRRRGRRGFGERQRPVGIDRVRTDIDEMRDRLLRQGFADRRHHADIFQHHRGSFAGRARRHDDERVIRRAAASRALSAARSSRRSISLRPSPMTAALERSSLLKIAPPINPLGAENDRASGETRDDVAMTQQR